MSDFTDSQQATLKAITREAMREEFEMLFTEDAAKRFWMAGFNVLQEQAQNHAGRFVLGSLGAMFRKVTIFVLIGGLVYAVGGWSALAGLFKTLFTSGSA